MVFAVQIKTYHRTRCSNCVVACPVDALELQPVVPEHGKPICTPRENELRIPDTNEVLPAGCRVCVQMCPHDTIRLTGPWETRAKAKVQ